MLESETEMFREFAVAGIFLIACAPLVQAGQLLDLNCSLIETNSRSHEFTHVDRAIVDTNDPPQVELRDTSTMQSANPSQWIFREGGDYGDSLKIYESGDTIVGSALRGIASNSFVLEGTVLTWAYVAPNADDVHWFRWKCTR